MVGLVIRQSLKATVVTYLGVGLGALNLLYFFPRYLQPELIGLRELLLGVALSLSILTQLGLQSAMSRFFPYFQDPKRQHNGFLLFSLGVAAFGFAVFGGLFALLSPWWASIFTEKSAQANAYWWMVLPLTAMMMLQNILEIWARLHYRIVVNALIRELGLRLVLTALTLGLGHGWLHEGQFLAGMCLSYGLASGGLVWYLKHLGILYLDPQWVRVRKSLRPLMLRYSMWMIVGGAGVVINERIDGLMLAWLAGLASTGIYSLSFFVGTIIEMPRRSISQIAGTLITHAWRNKDFAVLGKLHRQAALNQMLVGGLILVLVWTHVESIFDLMPNGDLYRSGKWVVFWIGLARWFDMSNGLNTEIILNSPYYRFNLVSIVFLSIVSFTANYLLIPVYGLTGAAAGSTLSILLFNLLKGGFLWFRLRIQPFGIRNLLALMLLLGMYGLGMGLNQLFPSEGARIFGSPEMGTLFRVACKSILVAGLFAVILLRTRLSPELSDLVQPLLSRLQQGRRRG